MMRAVSALAAPGRSRASRRSTRVRNLRRILACDGAKGEDSIAEDLRPPPATERVLGFLWARWGAVNREADPLPVSWRALADVVSWSRPCSAWANAPHTT